MKHQRKHKYIVGIFLVLLLIMTSCNSGSPQNGIIKEKVDLAVWDMSIEDYCMKYNQRVAQKYTVQSDLDKYKISASDFKLDAENVEGLNWYAASVSIDGFFKNTKMKIALGCGPRSNKIGQMQTVCIMGLDWQEMALSVLHNDALPLFEKIQEDVKNSTGDSNNVGLYAGVYKNMLIVREKDAGNGQLLSNQFIINIGAITEEMKKDLPSNVIIYTSI